jgi:hypothetical protein
MNAQKPPKRLNKLNITKQFKVCTWMTANVERMHHKTHEELAKLISAEVGFPVSHASIRPCIDAAGVSVEPSRARRNVAADTTAILKAAVIALYQRLGEPVPADLAGLGN